MLLPILVTVLGFKFESVTIIISQMSFKSVSLGVTLTLLFGPFRDLVL